MITKEHLKIYKRFDGDIDMWGRTTKSNDQITDAHWFEIEGLLQNLIIIKNGHASKEFTTKTLQQIKTSCENSEVEQELIEMAKGNW